MKKVIAMLFIILLLSNNCKKDNDVSRLIDSYYYGYMDYPGIVMPNPESDDLVRIEYNDKQISGRIGGLIPVPATTGFNYVFTSEVFDELTYTGNTISIITKDSTGELPVSPNKRIISLDDKNRMIQKISINESNDTACINYKYDSMGLLEESVNVKTGTREVSLFYFNSIHNLDSIVTRYCHQEEIISKKIEIFSDFDDASNPLKNLMIFKETFNRSLSENNYLEYQSETYDTNNVLVERIQKSWVLKYDNLGNPDFSEY